jgi:hypothetical protein
MMLGQRPGDGIDRLVLVDDADVEGQGRGAEADLPRPRQAFRHRQQLGHRGGVEGALREHMAAGQQGLHPDQLVLVAVEQLGLPLHHRVEVGGHLLRLGLHQIAEDAVDHLDEQGKAPGGA